MGFKEDIVNILKETAASRFGGNVSRMAEEADVSQSVLSKLLNGQTDPRLSTIGVLFNNLNIVLYSSHGLQQQASQEAKGQHGSAYKNVWSKVMERIDYLLSEEVGMSQTDLAKKLGVRDSAISNWRSGTRKGERVAFFDMLSYLDELEIPVEDFFPEMRLQDQAAALREIVALSKENRELRQRLSDLS